MEKIYDIPEGLSREDRSALIIGRAIQRHFKILVFGVDSFIQEDEYRGKIICSFVGKRREEETHE